MHGLDHGCDKDPLIVSQVSTSQVSDHVLTELTMPATYPPTCVGALQGLLSKVDVHVRYAMTQPAWERMAADADLVETEV